MPGRFSFTTCAHERVAHGRLRCGNRTCRSTHRPYETHRWLRPQDCRLDLDADCGHTRSCRRNHAYSAVGHVRRSSPRRHGPQPSCAATWPWTKPSWPRCAAWRPRAPRRPMHTSTPPLPVTSTREGRPVTRSPWPVLFTAVLLILAHANTAYAQAPLATAPAPCIGGEKDSRGRSSVDQGEVSWEDQTNRSSQLVCSIACRSGDR